MFHRLKLKRHKLQIKGQLYLVYLFSIFIPIVIIGFYLFFNTFHLIWGHYEANLKSDNLRIRSIICDTTTSITNISDDISADASLQKLLSSSYDSWEAADDALKNYTKLNTYLNRYTEISSITLYTNNPTLHDYGSIKKTTTLLFEEEWFKRSNTTFGYFWTTGISTNRFGVHTAESRLTRKVPILGTSEYAILVITISNNYLKSRIDSNTLLVDITVNNNAIFFSNWGNKEKAIDYPIDYSKAYFSFSGTSLYRGVEQLIEMTTIQPIKSTDKIYIVSLDPDALPYTRRILLIASGIVLIGVIVPLIIIVFFTKRFTTRVDTLRHEMHQVSNGNYNIIEKFRGNDELVELFQDLQTMIACIKQRDNEIYSEKISKQTLINHQQKMEFEILASQINPHFLYNTLETIRMKAFTVGDSEVSEAIKLLGKYMRHNLESSGTCTTLKTELDYIVIYLRIQKLRFGGRINYTLTITPEICTEKYLILPLLMQPVVENAILHGLEQMTENGQINIEVHTENENLLISISDNGIGMSPEILQQLNEKLRCPSKHLTTSIGLYNIHQRIQLFYGTGYGVEILSTLHQGTKINIHLPLHFDWEE